MKKHTIASLVTLGICLPLGAQDFKFEESIVFGAGYLDYLEGTDEIYLWGQFRTSFYETERFRHNAYIDITGYSEDTVVSIIPGDDTAPFDEPGDVEYLNITLNYELEAKINSTLSLYFGVGAGVEVLTLESATDTGRAESDTNFVAQNRIGLQARLSEDLTMQAGARILWLDETEFSLSRSKSEVEVGYEVGFGFQF